MLVTASVSIWSCVSFHKGVCVWYYCVCVLECTTVCVCAKCRKLKYGFRFSVYMQPSITRNRKPTGHTHLRGSLGGGSEWVCVLSPLAALRSRICVFVFVFVLFYHRFVYFSNFKSFAREESPESMFQLSDCHRTLVCCGISSKKYLKFAEKTKITN